MYILVVADDAGWRSAATAVLTLDGVTVLDGDLATAVASIAARSPDVLVCRWSEDGVAALQALGAAERTGRTYVLAVVPDDAARQLMLATAAGAHDVVRERYFAEEALMRIDARNRLSRWSRALGERGDDVRPTLATLRAWRHLGDLVSLELETMLGCPLVAERSAAIPTAGLHAAMLTLSFAAERYEMCVCISADEPTLARMTELLLGESCVAPEARADLLREMANAAGGAVKRSALPERVALTMGLPKDGAPKEFPQQVWIATGEGIRLVVSAAVRARDNDKVPASSLREGMVIVKDVRGSSGMLLVAGGTRLTMTTAVRLAAMLDERALVEIADVA